MPPVSMLIKPASSSCNMRCGYCFYADVSHHRSVCNKGIMDACTQESVVRRAMEAAEGSVSFAFQGGEPTLAGLDFFRRHVQLCRKYAKSGVRVFQSVQTNGFMIDSEWADFFAENGFLVGISLDGPKDIHDLYRRGTDGVGTYARTMQAVTHLRRSGAEFNVLSVVTRDAARNANRVMNFFINGGFSYLQFIPCLDGLDGNGGEWSLSAEEYGGFLVTCFGKYYSCFLKNKFLSVRNFDNYLSLMAGYPAEHCGMNGRCSAYFTVEGNGDVYPCDFYVTDEFCGGNVNRNSLFEIARSDVFRSFVSRSYPVSEECKSCRWFSLCRGGCCRYREPFVQGVPSLNRFCKSYQIFFSECAPLLVKMVEKRGR